MGFTGAPLIMASSVKTPMPAATTIPTAAAISVARTWPNSAARTARRHASAVHGEGRQHVEHHQDDVGKEQTVQQLVRERVRDEIRLDPAASPEGKSPSARPTKYQQPRDDHVDGRPGQGDAQLLPGSFAHPFQTGDAADRVKGDVPCADAEAPGHQGVSEFVQYDTAEDGYQQRKHEDRHQRSAESPGAKQDPRRQEQEGPVDVNAYAESGA